MKWRNQVLETFKFLTEVKLADFNGEPITEGSILKNIKDNDIGVVVRVSREDDEYFPMLSTVGDLHIKLDYGHIRITNKYSEWIHVKSEEQKFIHRFWSWQSKKFQSDEWNDQSIDIQWAINGIVSLIPPEKIDWENGPWPDNSLEEALEYLSKYLDELKNGDV